MMVRCSRVASPSLSFLLYPLAHATFPLPTFLLQNDTYPGQNAPPDNYAVELAAITDKLIAQTAAWGAKLVFATTTQYMCNANSDGCVQNLNNQAKAIMASKGVPVVGVYDAMRGKCGPSPTTCNNAFNMTNGLFCPHANSIACALRAAGARAAAPRKNSLPVASPFPLCRLVACDDGRCARFARAACLKLWRVGNGLRIAPLFSIPLCKYRN